MDGLLGCDFCKFVNWESCDDFYLYEMGSCACKPNYAYEHNIKNRSILHFVLSGKGTLYIHGVRHDIHGGQAFLIPDGVKCFYQADALDPWNYIWLHIGGPKLPETLKKIGLTADQPVYDPIAEWDLIIESLNGILENYSREYYCIGNLYRILDSMLLNSSTREEVQFDHTLLYVKNAIAFIKLNYSGPIRIDKLAYSFGLNRSYLTRLFKDATGYTLQEYVLIYRMKMATQLLLDTPESIQDIALAVGYTDTFTFSKAFKRHTGKSPSQYRAAQEADTPPADQTPPAQIS